jgi:hypothetical protein
MTDRPTFMRGWLQPAGRSCHSRMSVARHRTVPALG